MRIKVHDKDYLVLKYEVDCQYQVEEYIGSTEIGRDPSSIIVMNVVPVEPVSLDVASDDSLLGKIKMISMQVKVIVPDHVLSELTNIQKASVSDT